MKTSARYTIEFMLEAARLVDGGQSIAAAATRSFGLVEQALFNRVKANAGCWEPAWLDFQEHLARWVSQSLRDGRRRHLSDDALLAHIKAVHAQTRGGYGRLFLVVVIDLFSRQVQ